MRVKKVKTQLLYNMLFTSLSLALIFTYSFYDAYLVIVGQVCTQGAIRLQGGTVTATIGQGRVEICNNNVWGTVCDDLWGTPDAQVACRQLGYPTTGATALTLGAVPDGTGQIWLDNVQCRGTESTLFACPANPIGTHNCVHAEDAGVRCLNSTGMFLPVQS